MKKPDDPVSRRSLAMFLGGLALTPLAGGAMLLVVARVDLGGDGLFLCLLPPAAAAALAYRGAMEMTYGREGAAKLLEAAARDRDRTVEEVPRGSLGMAYFLLTNLHTASGTRVLFMLALFLLGLFFSAIASFVLVLCGF